MWRYGATIESIYKKFSKYGQNDIHISEKEKDKIKLSIEEREIIESVWEQLRKFHSFTLVKNIWSDSPHRNARRSGSIFILERDIEYYFKTEKLSQEEINE